MKLYTFILFLVVLSGCTPSQRLTRILRRHPELRKDSIKVYTRKDTIILPGIRKDSIINNVYTKDTVILKTNQLTTKYVYMGDNKAYINSTVKADTIIRNDTVRVVKTVTLKTAPLTFWQSCKHNFVVFCIAFFISVCIITLLVKTFPRI